MILDRILVVELMMVFTWVVGHSTRVKYIRIVARYAILPEEYRPGR